MDAAGKRIWRGEGGAVRRPAGQMERGLLDLAAKCASGLSQEALNQSLQYLFGELPDESFCDCLPLYLKSADQAFFEKSSLSLEQMLQIRTFLIKQLSGTRVFGWNKDREEGSAEMHLRTRPRDPLLQ